MKRLIFVVAACIAGLALVYRNFTPAVLDRQPYYELTSVNENGDKTVLKRILAGQLSSAGTSAVAFDLVAPGGGQNGVPIHIEGAAALNLLFTQIRIKMATSAKRCANSYASVILVFDELGRLILDKDNGPITFNPETIAQTISMKRYDADALSGSYELTLAIDATGALVFDKHGHVIAFDPTAVPEGSWNSNHDTYTVDATKAPCGG